MVSSITCRCLRQGSFGKVEDDLGFVVGRWIRRLQASSDQRDRHIVDQRRPRFWTDRPCLPPGKKARSSFPIFSFRNRFLSRSSAPEILNARFIFSRKNAGVGEGMLRTNHLLNGQQSARSTTEGRLPLSGTHFHHLVLRGELLLQNAHLARRRDGEKNSENDGDDRRNHPLEFRSMTRILLVVQPGKERPQPYIDYSVLPDGKNAERYRWRCPVYVGRKLPYRPRNYETSERACLQFSTGLVVQLF